MRPLSYIRLKHLRNQNGKPAYVRLNMAQAYYYEQLQSLHDVRKECLRSADTGAQCSALHIDCTKAETNEPPESAARMKI